MLPSLRLRYTYQASFTHQPGYPFTRAVDLVLAAQLGMNARRAVDVTALGVDSPNLIEQFGIFRGSS